jgi:hypothetical protein
MDNLNIHCKKPLTDLYGTEVGVEIWDRFTVHYTPTHGSWLNQAEIERWDLRPAVSGNQKNTRSEDAASRNASLNRRMNRDRVKINWKFTRRAARRKFGYEREFLHADRDLARCLGQVFQLHGQDTRR